MGEILSADTESDNFLFYARVLHTISMKERNSGEFFIYHDHPEDGTCSGSIIEGIERLIAADEVWIHNGACHDYPLLEKLFPQYRGKLDRMKLRDTLMLSRLYFGERKGLGKMHGLESWGEDFGVTKPKVHDFKTWNPKVILERVVSDVIIQDMLVDVILERQEELRAAGTPFEVAEVLERRASKIVMYDQFYNGLPVDVAAFKAYDEKLTEDLAPLDAYFAENVPPSIVPEWDFQDFSNKFGIYISEDGAPYSRLKITTFNPNSTIQCVSLLVGRGADLTETTEKGNIKLDDEILLAIDDPFAQALGQRKKLTKLQSMLYTGDSAWGKFLTPEGRLHGIVDVLGAQTSRMAHKQPNTAQLPKGAVVRSLVRCPDPCLIFLDGDAAALEMRLEGHYIHPYDGGRFSQTILAGDSKLGTDIHTLNKNALGVYARDTAKTFYYAMSYAAGLKKLGRIIAQDAIAAGMGFSGDYIAVGRTAKQKLFDSIIGLNDFLAKLEHDYHNDGCLWGLDGRKLYPKGVRTMLNTLLQGNGAIVMKRALIHFDDLIWQHKLDVRFCANIHDEILCEVPIEQADEGARLMKLAMEQVNIDFSLNCPMEMNTKTGRTWQQVH